MYGQVAASLRQTMTELLGIQKVSIHLGKGYGYTAGQDVTTPEERLAAVDRIMRYRAEIVDYCWRAATTVIPAKASKGWEAPRRVERWLESRRPEAGQLPGERRASADELATVQDIPLVELWRRAAVAAFTGRERELPLFPERVDVGLARVVVSDVAQLTNALLFLDRRCFQIDGWRTLAINTKGIRDTTAPLVLSPVRAALQCSEWARGWDLGAVQATDRLGYRPAQTSLVRTDRFGIAGAIAAQHNVFVRLNAQVPSADAVVALARVQRVGSELSRKLAQRAGEQDLMNEFRRRTRRYQGLLSVLTRDIAGAVGGGAQLVEEAQRGTRALSDSVEAHEEAAKPSLEWLAAVDSMIDVRLGERIQQGFDDRRYFVSREYRLAGEAIGGVRHAVKRFDVVTPQNHPEMAKAIRSLSGETLRQPKVLVSGDGAKGREDFGALITQLADARGAHRLTPTQARKAREREALVVQ